MSFTLKESVDDLRDSYIKWNDIQVLHTVKLYNLLASAMRIVEQVRAEDKEAELNKLLKQEDVKSSKKTTLEMKVVKLCLTDDRKRASSYSRVLIAAADENIKSNDLAKWIVDNKGIDKIRKKKAPAIDSSEVFKKNKMSLFSRKILIENFTVPNLDAHKNDIVVLIGRAGEDDTIDVFEIAVSSDNDALAMAAVKAALKTDDHEEIDQEGSQGGPSIDQQFAAAARGRGRGRGLYCANANCQPNA